MSEAPTISELAGLVSVVIPARNEARNLPHVLSALPEGLHEVILVDGNSDDDTIEVARRLMPDIVVVQQTRKGKGNALACGFAAVTGDVVVMLDADGSADPGEIPHFLKAIGKGADFAKGTRFAEGGDSDDITRLRRLGNSFLNSLVNVIFGTRYTDLCYGYNVFRTRLLPALELPPIHHVSNEMIWGDGFEIETLINVRVALHGARISEVGSVEKPRIHGVSNLNAVSDGLRVLRTIFAERRRARRAQSFSHCAKSSQAQAADLVIELREPREAHLEHTGWDTGLRGTDPAGPLTDRALIERPAPSA